MRAMVFTLVGLSIAASSVARDATVTKGQEPTGVSAGDC
jgi:hypothetical protein